MNSAIVNVDKLTFRIPRQKRIEFEARCDALHISMTEHLNALIDANLSLQNTSALVLDTQQKGKQDENVSPE